MAKGKTLRVLLVDDEALARQRLEQLYGADQSLSLRGADDGGVIAEVIIPFRKRTDLPSLDGLNVSGSASLGKTLHTTGVAAHG